jgi:hypothetical protein
MNVFDRLVSLFTNENADFGSLITRPKAGPIWLQGYAVRLLAKALKRLCAQFPSKVANDMFWLYCRVTDVWI